MDLQQVWATKLPWHWLVCASDRRGLGQLLHDSFPPRTAGGYPENIRSNDQRKILIPLPYQPSAMLPNGGHVLLLAGHSAVRRTDAGVLHAFDIFS